MVKQNVRHVEDAGIPHDVILAHYRGSQNDWDHTWYQDHVSESLVAKGYKFRLMQKAYKDGLWEKRYEFIWALDSDIDLSKADLPHFLEMARLSRSPIVGPTFVQADGKPLVPLLVQEHSAVVRREGHAPSRGSRRHAQQISGPNVIQSPDLGCDFRHTDFVELTAPLLKSEVLQLVLRDCRSCIQDKSDWGLDMMWCKYASKRLKNQACALIDSAPVVHLDWGLAPISQDFYRALHAVQATYGAYWSDHRVLDCKRRGEGLVEIPEEEDIEMGARNPTSSKKRQSRPAKAENSTRQKAGKAAKEQENNEEDPPEEDVGDDGLPVESQSKETEGDDDGSDNSEGSPPRSEDEEEEEEEDNDAVPSRKTGKATRTASNASAEASPSKKSKSSKTPSSSADSSWASEADRGKRAEADGSDEELSTDADVRNADTGGNASHSKAEETPARSMPSEGIFKVKAAGQAAEPTLDDGILPSNSRLSIGELAPTAASAVENTTLRKTPQGSKKATDVATNQGSENEAYQDLSLGDEEDLDLDWPEAENKASEVKSRQEAKHLASSAKMTKPGSRRGQDATIEIREVSQSAALEPVGTADFTARAFEETEHRLREDIESLRKLEEELQLRGPKGTSQPKQRKAQKAEGSSASHKRRKGPAAAAAGQQAVSLLELASAPASEEELQTLQIEQLAAAQREVAMKAAEEVADSSTSPLTAEQLDRTRRAALQSVEHAVAAQVDAQERQQTAKAGGAMSELFAGIQSDSKAIASKMVKQLQADLTATKEQAETDHQVEEQKVSVLLERLDHLRSQSPKESSEDMLLSISRARQILELKAQVQWDSQRLSKEKEDELALKVKIKQLEDKLRRQRHASLRKATRSKPSHHRASAQKIAVDVDHSGRTLAVEHADPY